MADMTYKDLPQFGEETPVPMFDPSGTMRSVPYNQLAKAVKSGGHPAILIESPDGKRHYVPQNRVQEATTIGKGKIIPIQNQPNGIPEWYGFTPSNVGKNMWTGAKGLVQSMWSLGEDLVNNPNWLTGRESTAQKFVFEPSDEQVAKMHRALKQGRYSEAFGHALASAVPLVGPWAASIGEQAGTSDIGGAVGQMAGTAIAGEATVKLPKVLKRTVETVKSPFAETGEAVRKVAGTAPYEPGMAEELTEKRVAERQAENVRAEEKHAQAVEKRQTQVEKVEKANAEAQEAYNTQIGRLNEDFDQKVAKVKEQYADDVKTREEKVAQLRADHEASVQDARQKWVEKQLQARGVSAENAKVEARRQTLEHVKARTYPDLIKENVDGTYKSARSDYDARWNQWREDVGGPDTPIPNESRAEAIGKARTELSGVPADLQVFNQVMKEIEGEEAAVGGKTVEAYKDSEALGLLEEKPEGGLETRIKENTPLAAYQRQHTAIGQKAMANSGNVGRVLRDVYEASGKPLDELSKSKGVGDEYANLKKYTSQFLDDWYDTKSPLAKLRGARVTDRGEIAARSLGRQGDTLRAQMGRYRDNGSNPDLVSKLRGVQDELEGLPKSKAAKVQVPELPAEPGKAMLSIGRAKLPTLGAEPAPVPFPESDIAAIEAERAKRIGRVEKPEPQPLPAEVEAFVKKPLPSVDEIVEDLKEAKRRRGRRTAAAESKINRHDMIMAGIAAMGVWAGGHLMYATVYLPMRWGWRKFFNSDLGMRVMTRVTPTDIAAIKEVLNRIPEEKAEAGEAMTDAIIKNADNGKSVPPPQSLRGLLSMRQIGRIVGAIMNMRKRGKEVPITEDRPSVTPPPPPPVTPPGTETQAGAAFDNTVLEQVRREHPEWTVSQQLQEAARRAKAARTPTASTEKGTPGAPGPIAEALPRGGLRRVGTPRPGILDDLDRLRRA